MTNDDRPSGGGRPSFLERVGAVFFAWRNWLFTAGLLGLLILFRPVPLGGSRTADLLMDLFGFVVTLAGQMIRIGVIGYSPIRSGGTRKKVAADSLLTTGLLAHVRNPLYVGNILVMAGLVLIHNNPWVYLLGLPATLFAYTAIVAGEEAFLAGRFGEE